MRPLPEYGFANFERNHIQYPGDSLAMERFFQKMDSVVFMGQGNLNIMHIGGSHVQVTLPHKHNGIHFLEKAFHGKAVTRKK